MVTKEGVHKEGLQGMVTKGGVHKEGLQGMVTKEGVHKEGLQGRVTKEGVRERGLQGRVTKEGVRERGLQGEGEGRPWHIERVVLLVPDGGQRVLADEAGQARILAVITRLHREIGCDEFVRVRHGEVRVARDLHSKPQI